MSISFRVPATLVLGRVKDELALWSSTDGSVSTLGKVPGIELMNDLRVDRQVSGHMAIASFGQYVIKAIDMGSRYGSYTLNEDSLVRIPSRGDVDLRKFNDWFTIRNTFILVGDPTEYVSDNYPLICPYRVGDTLFVNVGYVGADDIKTVLTALGILRNYAEGGRISTTCLCRVPTMPLEIALISGDKYLLFRTHLNNARRTRGSKYLVLLTRGGNVVGKVATDGDPLNEITEMLNEMKAL